MPERTCAHCEKRYEGHGLSKHCSKECYDARQLQIQIAWRDANRDRVREQDRQRYAAKGKKRPVGKSSPKQAKQPTIQAGTVIACEFCSQQFTVEKTGVAKYCSKSCGGKAWKACHPERVQATRAAYTPKPGAVLAATRTWRKKNPGRATASKDGRRRKAPYDAEALAYKDLIATDPCVYCGNPSSTVDHIVPIHRGGTSQWTNLAPACVSCNSRKATKTLLRFLLDRKAASDADMARRDGGTAA